MKKLFISQPMRGLSDEDILVARNNLIEKVKRHYKEEEIEVVDSFFEGVPADAKPLYYLGKSLELLSTADIAVFAEGWDQARGCMVEHHCCLTYGIDFLYERDLNIRYGL